MKTAVLLLAHGTVENLDELGSFLTNIRRGHPPTDALLSEVKRRYEAIGGKSPLHGIHEALARKVERELSLPVRVANRLWHPYPKEVLSGFSSLTRLLVIALAQHSAHVYEESARAALCALFPEATLVASGNWGGRSDLCAAQASRLRNSLATLPARTLVVLSAHSLPLRVIASGDRYAESFTDSARAIAGHAAIPFHALASLPPASEAPQAILAYQSQGLGAEGEWLGPTLDAALVQAKEREYSHVLVAPVGFLADHVEILYDIDIEAKGRAENLGLSFSRTESMNASDDMVQIVAQMVRDLL